MCGAPLLENLNRRAKTGAHRRLALAFRLEPNGKAHRLLHNVAVAPSDLLGAGLDPEGRFGEARDDAQSLVAQRPLKAVASLIPAVGDHADVKVVADAVGLGAAGDDRIEGL